MLLESPSLITEAVKTVRKYADGFGTGDGFDLRQLSKGKKLHWTRLRKLQRMYDEIDFGQAKLHVVMRIKKPAKNASRATKIKYTKRKRAMQEAGLQERYPKNLNVAFIPVANPRKKTTIIWEGNKIKRIKQKGEPDTYVLDWVDPERLVTDLAQEIEDTLSQAPEAKTFHIQAGRHTIWNQLLRADELEERIKFLMGKYAPIMVDTSTGLEYANPNSYQDWLGGVVGFKIEGKKAADFQGTFEKKKRKVNALRGGLKKTIRALEKRKTELTRKEKRTLDRAKANLQKII